MQVITAEEAYAQGTRPWVLYSCARFNDRAAKAARRNNEDPRPNIRTAQELHRVARELKALWRGGEMKEAV